MGQIFSSYNFLDFLRSDVHGSCLIFEVLDQGMMREFLGVTEGIAD